MRYLIDGYNLLHAMGALQGRTGPTGLEKARRRLLGLLASVYGRESAAVVVVFDAAGARAGAAGREDHLGIRILFAVEHEQADDMIEALIRRDSAPRGLTVVSDDRRLREAARRRHCRTVGCLDYLDDLDRRRRAGRAGPKPEEKRYVSSPEEILRWQREFKSIEGDPDARAFLDPEGPAGLP